MHRGIGRIIELLEQISVGNICHQLLSQRYRSIHSQGTVSELQLGAISPQHGPTLGAHRVRHGENQPVAPSRRHHCKGDPGVAASGFHKDRLARNDRAGLLRLQHHCTGNTVFDRGRRVEALQFGQNFGLTSTSLRQAVQSHEGRAADQGRDVGSNAHWLSLPTYEQ